MLDRSDILEDLISSRLNGFDHIDEEALEEVSLGSLVKGAVAVGAIATALKAFKLPPPSKYSQRSSAIDFAKALVRSKDNKELISATVGLLNICGRVFLKIPELRDLGYKIMKVVQSERLEDFME